MFGYKQVVTGGIGLQTCVDMCNQVYPNVDIWIHTITYVHTWNHFYHPLDTGPNMATFYRKLIFFNEGINMSNQPSRQFNGSGHQKQSQKGKKHGAMPQQPIFVQSGIPAGYQTGYQPGLPNGGVMPNIPQHDPSYVPQYEPSYAEQYNPPPQQNYIYVQQVDPNMQPGIQQVAGHPQQVIYTSMPQQVYNNQVPPPCYGPPQTPQMVQQPQPQVIQAPQMVQTMVPPVTKPNNQGNQSNQNKQKDPGMFKGVPCRLMYGLHKNCMKKLREASDEANNHTDSTRGILFYHTDINKANTEANGKWKTPFLGKAIELNPSQVEFIVKFLGLTDDPFEHGAKPKKSDQNIPQGMPQQVLGAPQQVQPGMSQGIPVVGAPPPGTQQVIGVPQQVQPGMSQAQGISNMTVTQVPPPSNKPPKVSPPPAKQSKQSKQPTQQVHQSQQPNGIQFQHVQPTAPPPNKPVQQVQQGVPTGGQQFQQQNNQQQPKKVTISQHALSPNSNPQEYVPPNVVVYTTYSQVPNLLDL